MSFNAAGAILAILEGTAKVVPGANAHLIDFVRSMQTQMNARCTILDDPQKLELVFGHIYSAVLGVKDDAPHEFDQESMLNVVYVLKTLSSAWIKDQDLELEEDLDDTEEADEMEEDELIHVPPAKLSNGYLVDDFVVCGSKRKLC